MQIFKWIALVVAALLVGLAIFLAVFDWNSMRGYIGEKVSQKYGREFTINGNLDVDFFPFPPRIHAEQLRLANADWGSGDTLLAVEQLDFSISLLNLLKGDIVLPEVSLVGGEVLLEVSTDGKRNWIMDQQQSKDAESPRIGRLIVDQSTLIFRDPAIQTDITVTVAPAAAAQDAREASIQFTAQGQFKGLQVKADGQGGKVLGLMDMQIPYPIKANIQIGETHGLVDGTISGLSTLAAVDTQLNLRGNTLAALSPLIGIPLPPTPPYQVEGRLIRQADTWQFNKFSGKVGDSDMAGDFNINVGGKKPFIRGKVVSRQLDLDDLGGMIGAPPQTGPGETASSAQKKAAKKIAGRARVLPDTDFKFARLGAVDADVKLTATSIRGIKHPLDNLYAHMKIDNGKVTLQPLNFGVAGGDITSNIILRTDVEPHTAQADITIKKLALNKLFPTVQLTQTGIGLIGGEAKFSATGNSIAELLGSANGRMGFAMAGGTISNMLLEIIGIDGAEIVKFLFGGDKNVSVRCMVADFKVNDGLMNAEVLVLDTTDTSITGEGNINLKEESINLTLKPLPKDASFLSLRSPLFARGTFKNPQFAPDMKKVAARTGAAVALGALLTPLAALMPLIESGPGKDSDCGKLIADISKHQDKPAPPAGKNPEK